MNRLILLVALIACIPEIGSAQNFQKAILRHRVTGVADSIQAGQWIKLQVLDDKGEVRKINGYVRRITPDTFYMVKKSPVPVDRIQQVQYRPGNMVLAVIGLLFLAYLLLGTLSILGIVVMAEPVSWKLALLLLVLGVGALVAGLTLNRKSRHRFSDFRNSWTIEVAESPPAPRAVQIP